MSTKKLFENAEIINNSMRQYFVDLGWSDSDVQWALEQSSALGISLAMSLHIPTTDKRFPEVLRCVANTQEIIKDIFKKEIKDSL